MTQVMSKFLAMGVPLRTLFGAHGQSGAGNYRPELGTLSVGKEADIAVLEQLNGSFGYIDCGFARMDGKSKLMARMTVRAGGLCLIHPGSAWWSGKKRVRNIFLCPAWIVPHGRWRMTIRESETNNGARTT